MAEPRRVEACPHRRVGQAGEVVCGLLRELVGREVDEGWARVPEAACEACVQEFAPSVRDLNPVVASLAYERAGRIERAGGVAGCGVEEARRLRRRAAGDLPDEEEARRLGSASGAFGPVERVVPAPGRRHGPRVGRWAVGVTTAPREVPTLGACLESLAAAGFPAPHLFVDGEAAVGPPYEGLSRTERRPQVGAWGNYYLGLGELVAREPEADAFLMMQDDAVVFGHGGLRRYLEGMLWPEEGPGLVSLFCSRAYDRPGRGWQRFEGVWRWCALAFVFSREAAEAFLADRGVVGHSRNGAGKARAGIDTRIGAWSRGAGVPIWYPCPSLVQHIGHTSTLWPGVRVLGERRAGRFAGDEREREGG